MAIKTCRKCHSSNLENFFGTNGAFFIRCKDCGHKARTGLSADVIADIVRKELAKVGGQAPVMQQSQAAPVPSAPAPVPTVSSKDVQTLVNKAIAQRTAELKELAKPAVIEVRHETGKPSTIQGAHVDLARLIKVIRAGLFPYLWGDAGTGKTTAALQAAELLKLDAEIDTMDPTTFRSMVQGYMTPKGDPVHTSFTRCWEQGLMYVADETDNAPGHVQTLFNSALANNCAPLAWGNVPRHKKFVFIGTGNTPGRPTKAFPDRKPMSAAFADRLYFMHWRLDPTIEARAAGMPMDPMGQTLEGPDMVTPEQWVKFVIALRSWARTNAPTLMITPRASLVGLQALKIGERPMHVADALIFRGADAELRAKALSAVGF